MKKKHRYIVLDGVKTLIPKYQVNEFKQMNLITIYFLEMEEDDLLYLKEYLKTAKLIFHKEGYIVLNVNKDRQYALESKGKEILIEKYNNQVRLSFAFENSSGKLLDNSSPVFASI